MEQWKDIAGYEGFYQVSDFGDVRSIGRSIFCKSGEFRYVPGQLLSPWKTEKGYLAVSLSRGSDRKKLRVHRLVLTAFVGPPAEGEEGCHRDNDPSNNRLENLRWGTSKSNHADKLAIGTTARGEKCGASKLKVTQVAEIKRQIAEGIPLKDIARSFSISQPNVTAIKQNRTWRHINAA